MALAALTGCGGDGETVAGGGGKSLPKAKDVAAMERFVSQYVTCADVETELPEYSESRKGFKDVPKGAGAGVKEQAYCKSQGGPIALVAISDMKKFQLALKANEAAGKDRYAVALVGEDFAVVPTGGDTMLALKSSGLLVASCSAKFNSEIPSGYTKNEGKVDGCVMTDFIPG
ncbi:MULTISPECIES: hypothetical protein [unclassified Streptomyces]|uniref:hypothetical protein n=1 Tax=unclassified Streptomyces TaxID=2593676 RepID=UPI00225219B0|nr:MULTISPECIES: hypothetical protein [unclassified Streptomyces]MCX4527025.1 hypothetical protein [Streptomyces sp. NBC_01551]MCX4542415.1 hypothetical protein [Streptomyces sp. NBC_01565]